MPSTFFKSRTKQVKNNPSGVRRVFTLNIGTIVFGLLFIILGIVLLVYSNKVKSAEIEYSDCALNTVFRKQILIEDDIDQPWFV